MTFMHRLSIRNQLLLMVLAVLVPAAGLVAWYIGHYWQEARKAAYARVKIVADNTASNLENILRDNEAVLSQLAERPLIRALDPTHCDPVLAQYISVRPEYSTLAVRDAQANIVCSLLPNPPPTQL